MYAMTSGSGLGGVLEGKGTRDGDALNGVTSIALEAMETAGRFQEDGGHGRHQGGHLPE